VTDKQMHETKWEDLPRAVRQIVIGNANELARDQRFREFTDSLSTAYHVLVDQALVAKLNWPSPQHLRECRGYRPTDNRRAGERAESVASCWSAAETEAVGQRACCMLPDARTCATGRVIATADLTNSAWALARE
jgi:hypothetical protein